ncbi:MAG: PrsW family intramembrane metalloprotease [Bacteroidales bacterium]|nr:PrsW family intramembrane metalloprotease [Bacteroidales bacterium]
MGDSNMVLWVLALLPVLVLAVFVYVMDRYEKEPLRMLLKAFFCGVFAVVVVIPLEYFFSAFAPSGAVLHGIYEGFVVAGFSEELCKLLVFMLFIWRSRHFNEYFDGIVYAVYVGLGFACLENVGYVFQSGLFQESLVTGVTRALLSVPAHFLFAVAMGYYLSKAKFDVANRASSLLKALFYPLLLHGTFDALLMVSDNLKSTVLYPVTVILFIFFIRFDIKMWKKGMVKIREMQERSRMQETDRI